MPSFPSSRNASRDPSYERATQSDQSTGPSFLAFPVKHVVNSAIRRFAADPLSRHLTAHRSNDENSRSSSQGSSAYASSANLASLIPSFNADSFVSSFAPPRKPSCTPPRHTSPFQPPPLTPLNLSGYKSSTPPSAQLLGKLLAEEIRLLVPPRLQVVAEWRLLFSLEQDGASLGTLYSRCSDVETIAGISGVGVARGGCVVVAKDTGGNVSSEASPNRDQGHHA